MNSEEELKFTDFKLVSSDGKIHPCYKHVLYSISPYFKAMLETDWAETNNGVMEVPQHDATTVKNFLKYINAKEAGNDIVQRLRETAQPGEHIFKRQFDKDQYNSNLLKMAHLYQVEDLQNDCAEHLSKTLAKENVVHYWAIANTIDCTKLKTAAIDFIAQHVNQGDIDNFPGLFHSDHTTQLMKELLKKISRHKKTEPGQIEKAIEIITKNQLFSSTQSIQKTFLKACQKGNLTLLNWMMDIPGGLDIDMYFPEGGKYSCFTVGFWLACEEGHLSIVNLLLDSRHHTIEVDAELDENDFSKWIRVDQGFKASTAFHAACMHGRYLIVKRLLEFPAGTIELNSGFVTACSRGYLNIVKYLLQLPEGRIQIQAKDDSGWNGFLMACYGGHLGVVNLFLELPSERFNVDERYTATNETGYDIAVGEGHHYVAAAIRKYMLEIGVKAEQKG